MSEASGRLRLETLPSLQLPAPEEFVDTRFTTQVLVAGLLVFGMGSGGPKRHPVFPGYSGLMTPAAVQLRLLPVSVLVVAARVSAPVVALQLEIFVIEVPWSGTTEGSGTPTPAPPK